MKKNTKKIKKSKKPVKKVEEPIVFEDDGYLEIESPSDDEFLEDVQAPQNSQEESVCEKIEALHEEIANRTKFELDYNAISESIDKQIKELRCTIKGLRAVKRAVRPGLLQRIRIWLKR